MVRDTGTGSIMFNCYCGVQEKGDKMDALIASDVLHTGQTAEMYRRLMRNAAHDRVNQQVKKDCPNCGRDYMTQIRVGDREVVVWVCKCGYTDSLQTKNSAKLHE